MVAVAAVAAATATSSAALGGDLRVCGLRVGLQVVVVAAVVVVVVGHVAKIVAALQKLA